MKRQKLLQRRLGVLLAVAILVTLLMPAAAQATTQKSFPFLHTAVIRSTSGAAMGTATFQWDAFGQAIIEIRVRGFEPVGGDRRVGITNVGYCCAPTFHCGGAEIVRLPNIQFYPDGSASYRVVTTALQPHHLRGPNGSTIAIHADVHPHSAIIGCGVIVPFGGYPVPPPGPPHVPPPPPPPPTTVPPPPKPTPVPPPFDARPVQVNAPVGLRLRSQPRLTASVVLTLFHGEWVTPLAAPVWSDGLSWTRVQVCRAGRCFTGYAATSYLGTAAAPAPPATRAMRVVAPAGLRLRAGAGTQHAIRRIVPNGTILQATGVERTAGGLVWAQVRIDGVLLWAAKNYLTPA